MKNYALYVKVDDYAYGVWFEVVSYKVADREIVIADHLFKDYITFRIDEKMEFKGVEVAK